MNRPARVLALVAALAVTACTPDPAAPSSPPPVEPGPQATLRVLAGSELADMRPILDGAAEATGVTVKFTFTGTLEGTDTVARGGADGKFDAVWFSSTRYLETIPEAKGRLAGSARIMTSPAVLGVRESAARRLGWDRDPVTWSDIAAAARRGEFTFGMTDPAASNTGFSALVAVAAALDGTGRALDAAAIDRIAPQLIGFFSGHKLTAGSSEWLADAFVRRATGADPGEPLDGLVNYESSLIALNRGGTLPEPLVLVHPRDGVVSADYPLTLLAGADGAARAAHERLTAYLHTADAQRAIVDRTARRAGIPGVPLPKEAPADLVELPFPETRAAIDALLAAYFDRLRRPARTVYVLDTSGSMRGNRLAALRRALSDLTGVNTTLSGRYCRFRSREEVIFLPFNRFPGTPRSFVIDARNPQRSRDAIRTMTGQLRAAGTTAVYDSLITAHRLLGNSPDRFLSIVLMTDGESNVGRALPAFESYVAGRTAPAPVFPILFGEAAEHEMHAVADATGGNVWDARHSDLGRAFCQIRGYQ